MVKYRENWNKKIIKFMHSNNLAVKVLKKDEILWLLDYFCIKCCISLL